MKQKCKKQKNGILKALITYNETCKLSNRANAPSFIELGRGCCIHLYLNYYSDIDSYNDIVLITKNDSELRTMAGDLMKASGEVGLLMNLRKTKIRYVKHQKMGKYHNWGRSDRKSRRISIHGPNPLIC